MLPEQQQRILGYFIEEARDHLSTIEQGLLDLQNTLKDSEMVNEIFRAAHSIKGGAAMLGLNSIQRTAHRLEDFFKVLKECQSIQIDQTIESLFLRMFDNLQALLDHLQSESGLTEDVADRLMSEVEPVFATLEQHLESQMHQAGGTMQLEESFAAPTLMPHSAPATTASQVSVFQNSVPEILRQMLQLFKQAETPQTRQQLEQLCNQLAQLGEQFNLSGWCTLCETAAHAIANLDNTYRILAPIVIKEIKQAQELVLASRADAIATCEQLQALSLKTFLSDWEDTSTNFESQDKQLTETIEVAQQQTTQRLSSTQHNSVESESLVNIAQLTTEEQITDWVAEDNLSSLFTLNSNDNNQDWQDSDLLDFNIEDDLENSLIKHSKDNLPQISSEETLALNSLFDEAQDTSLDLMEVEPAFCDLFKAPEADLKNLDLLEVSTTATAENSDLSSLWTEEPDTTNQIELDIKEFSFSNAKDDLFASSQESFALPPVPLDANNDVDSHIDFALSNSSEPKQKFDDNWFVESADLTTVLECTLSSDSNDFLDAPVNATPTPAPEITTDVESSLTPSASDLFSSMIAETESKGELFETPADALGVELDFSLDSSSTDLFSTRETESKGELFEALASVPSVENSAELIAGFDDADEQLDFSLDSTSADLFSTRETESKGELFEAPDSVPSSELDFSLDGSTDLFSTEESERGLELFENPASTPGLELNFSLDNSTDLLSSAESQSSLELFEAPADAPGVENTANLMAEFDLTSEELDFSLDSSSADLFNTRETEADLELFEVPDSVASSELDFSLDSSSADLFSTRETESDLELFEAPNSVPSVDNTANLMAEFDLTSEELDFSLDSSSADLFSTRETESKGELLEAFDSVPSVENTAQLMAGFDDSGEELDFSLDSTNTDLLSGETQSSLELFEALDSVPSSELDFSLDSSTDLLSFEESESSLELFDVPTSTGVDNTAGLMAGFDDSSEELDFSLDSSTDLLSFEESESSLELFDVPTSTGVDNTAGLMAGFDDSSEELDFSLDSSTDLLSFEESESSLELFDVPTSTGVDNTAGLMAGFDDSSEELDFSLDSSTDLFSTEESQSSLELFEVSTQPLGVDNTAGLMAGFDDSGEELDFSLDSSTDLFSTEESQSSLELFEDPRSTPIVENATRLMAEFDLINSTEMALEQELNRLDMGVEEMPSQTELFHEDSAASVEFDLEVQEELPSDIATVAEDFAQLEALLLEESNSNVVAQAEVGSNLNTLSVAPVIQSAAPESSNDEFGDLEKLLQETPTPAANPETVKPPQQKQAATNSRRSAFEQMMRVPVKQLDSISNQVGELVVYRNSLEQDQERLRQFLDNLLHQVQQLGDVGSRMQELYERSLVEASLLTSRTGSQSVSNDTAPVAKGHVTGINFDALEMDRFTGFHTLAQEMIELIVRVREASSDIEFVTGETEQVARQFRQVTTQLQEGITRSRMVPFSQIAERLPRAVRDISLKYGKQAELQIEGKETLIDKVILEQLYDPMTHLVNNAITHGIESSDERSAKGKSPVGQITIRAFHQGNQTVITVSDDGAGIDPERVKAKAIKNGLITPEAANNMSRLDVYNLLFHAGFSTKDAVDEFAGRGVGMDVVLTSLSQIRGTITTDSTLGKGTTFTIRLPLTLSICKALCCLSDKARIAFPMDGVEQMIDIPVESVITNAQGQTCIHWHDSLLPFRHLREFLTFNRQISRGTIYGSNRDDNMISVVVLRSADMFFAIQVDQVLGEQEIVIKQFEGPAPKPVGIAGATILGDGRIMPIADVLELIDLSMGRIRQTREGTWWTANDTSLPPETKPVTRTEPMVLIIDDSITVRELLSMTFINAGYRVEQARDGQEAWDKLRDGLPCDLIFCDIEMPRMDGLELLSRMQQDAKLSQLPIAMLTSRGSDRHRQMALQLGASGYFTKPYLEEALLDGAQRMLKGEVLLTPSSK